MAFIIPPGPYVIKILEKENPTRNPLKIRINNITGIPIIEIPNIQMKKNTKILLVILEIKADI